MRHEIDVSAYFALKASVMGPVRCQGKNLTDGAHKFHGHRLQL